MRTGGLWRAKMPLTFKIAPLKVLVILTLGAFIFGACGVKTHPFPELVTLPGPVEDIGQEQDSSQNFVMSWKAPLVNMAGRPLKVLSHFEIWEADYPIEDFCEGCPSEYRKAAEVHLQPPAPGLDINPGPYYWGKSLASGRVYRFRVAGYSARGMAHPESFRELTVWALEAPGPLEGFAATHEDLAVRVRFNPPGQGESVQLERSVGGGPFIPLTLTASEYVDLNVAYDNTYSYRGRRVRQRDGTLVPGPYTRELAVLVEDLVPLRPLSFLDASLTPQGVLLYWESLAEEPELAGYRVYRSLGPDDPFKPIGGLIKTNTYLDVAPPKGAQLRYSVTSVDTSVQANESLASPVAEIFFEEFPEPGEKPDLRNLGY
jgi:hypothetical protein